MKDLSPLHVQMLKTICDRAKLFNKPPAFLMYAADWMGSKSVRAMSPAQRGGYIDLMCCCWDDPELSVPDEPDKLRRSCSMDSEEWTKHGGDIRECFSIHPFKPGHLTQRRLIEVRHRQLERQQQAKEASRKAHGLPDDTPDDISDGIPPDPSREGSFSGSQVLSSQGSQVAKSQEKVLSPDALALSDQAYQIVSRNFPDLPSLKDKAARVRAWAVEADRFLKRSGKTAREVSDFLAWAGADVETGQARQGRRPWTGWRSQFQSMAILSKETAWAAYINRNVGKVDLGRYGE
jgi:uncharacterized protein YdaU (DUF1376 family)